MAVSLRLLRFFVYKSYHVCIQRALHIQRICYNSSGISNDVTFPKTKTIEECFLNEHVQQILKKITGLDFVKIFQPVKQKLNAPQYKFVTDEELKELREETHKKALSKLQMPPVLSERKPIDEIISKNPEVQGYETCNIVFTDISPLLNDKNRTIVVREPNGILREANWDERFRMNQVYFPMPFRKMTTPQMFEGEYLLGVLQRKEYLFLLDRACVQFEPDDSEYIRVTHTTYEHINKENEFNILRSTRHFGPMAFYFAYHNKTENLMIDMLNRELLSDAVDLVKLIDILQSENLQISRSYEENPLDVVKDFISRNDSVQKSNLELAFQTYCEIHKNESSLQFSA